MWKIWLQVTIYYIHFCGYSDCGYNQCFAFRLKAFCLLTNYIIKLELKTRLKKPHFQVKEAFK